MRTIGKKNIRLVRKISMECMGTYSGNKDVVEIIREKLPLILWETWESADAEINMIIEDVVMNFENYNKLGELK